MPQTHVRREYTRVHREEVGKYYKDRRLINTGTRVDEGLLVVGFDEERMENVVVDWEKYKDDSKYNLPSVMRASLNLAQSQADSNNIADIPDHIIAKAVYQNISNVMDYDMGFVEDVVEGKFHGKKLHGRKISLQSIYMYHQKGVCRHMGLIAAAVLERMSKQNIIQGTGIINENLIDKAGGHLWAEYVNRNGTRIVIDPAQGYFGSPKGGGWNYNPDMALSDINPEMLS